VQSTCANRQFYPRSINNPISITIIIIIPVSPHPPHQTPDLPRRTQGHFAKPRSPYFHFFRRPQPTAAQIPHRPVPRLKKQILLFCPLAPPPDRSTLLYLKYQHTVSFPRKNTHTQSLHLTATTLSFTSLLSCATQYTRTRTHTSANNTLYRTPIQYTQLHPLRKMSALRSLRAMRPLTRSASPRFTSSSSTSNAARVIQMASQAERPSTFPPVFPFALGQVANADCVGATEAAVPLLWAVCGALTYTAWTRMGERGQKGEVERLLIV
jgi:hypothetical protein